MTKCGLLGRHLAHSYSPRIHSHLGDYPYSLFEVEPEDLERFLKDGDFTGINVTIPYKKAVMEYLDEVTPRAKALGAVNTVVRTQEGKLVGHNTDYFGFQTMVRTAGLDVSGKKVLVLGSGGASNTAVAVLRELGADVIVISRSGSNNYRNLHLHADAAVIVNATPVGMYPDVESSPVDLDLFSRLEGVLDIVYNPARTKLLLEAENRGVVAENGLWMLVAQAKESAEWFAGHPISDAVIPEIYRQLRSNMENIILIGMPGCGKSTVAAILAQRLGTTAVDADKEIEEKAGCTIPEIFASSGEEGFRALEHQVLQQLGKESGKIIATGGGCVTRPENYPALHRNGQIFWLQRSIDALPTEGRPLSMISDLHAMYHVREPLYRQFADHIIDNNGAPEEAAAAIAAALTSRKDTL